MRNIPLSYYFPRLPNEVIYSVPINSSLKYFELKIQTKFYINLYSIS